MTCNRKEKEGEAQSSDPPLGSRDAQSSSSQFAQLMTLVRQLCRLSCTTSGGCSTIRESVTSLVSGVLKATRTGDVGISFL